MQGPGSIAFGRARRAGVSLLEVLVSLVIAVAGLSVAIAAIAQSERSATVIERTNRELELARTVIEEAFLGVLPEEAIVESSASTTLWRGRAADGLEWEALLIATVSSGFNARQADGRGGLGEVAGIGPGQMPIELITVRVGSVELRTTRW